MSSAPQFQKGSAGHLARGSLFIFFAESLVFPTGIIVTIYLTRKLGAFGFGIFSLVSVLIGWVERSLTEFFGRATIKFIGEADDWRAVAATVTRLHLISSVGVAVLIWFGSSAIADWLNEPLLSRYLRIFCFDIPIFLMARAFRNVLIGVGNFGSRAAQSAGRWLSRLCFIVIFVEMGFSVSGAIWGTIAASAVECAIGYFFIRLPFTHRLMIPVKKFWGYSIPIFLSTVLLVLYQRMDLFMLKMLGGTTEQAGFYGAAQTIYLVYGVVTLALAPLLLSTIAQNMKRGDSEAAKNIGSDALRFILFLFPLAAVVSGASWEIFPLVFGASFEAGSTLFSYLIFSMLSISMISIVTSIMTAYGKPRWTLYFMMPLPPLAFMGLRFTIPLFGPLGAAATTTAFSVAWMCLGLAVVQRSWRIGIPFSSILKCVLIGISVYLISFMWSAPHIMLAIKIVSLSLAVIFFLFLSGEIRKHEIQFLFRLLNPSKAVAAKTIPS